MVDSSPVTGADGTQRGGRRIGAGNKVGNRFDAAQAAVMRKRATDKAAANRLNPPPHIETVLRLNLAGYGRTAICSKTGRPLMTVNNWIERYADWLATERATLLADARHAFEPYLEQTLKGFAEALASEDWAPRLRAMEHVSRRLWGPETHAQSGATVGVAVNISFGSYTADQQQPVTIEHQPVKSDDPGES